MPAPRMPYFDVLFAELAKQDIEVEQSFGRHVHWGYWARPQEAVIDAADYGRAAERLTVELCDLAAIADNLSVLDAGCGFGGTIASLNERFTGLDLAGLNIDSRQLDRARKQVHATRGNKVEFVEGDACALPFASSRFDRVLAVECIFHFPSRAVFFKEAMRVLKPGGILALSDFVPATGFLPLAALAGASWLEAYNIFGRIDVRATLRRYRELAKATGFASLAERDITRQTLPTYAFLMSLLARRPPGDAAVAIARPMVRLSRLFARLGLVKYHLLTFRKPA